MRSIRNKIRQSVAAYIDYVFNDTTSGLVMANTLYDTDDDLIAQYGKCHSTVFSVVQIQQKRSSHWLMKLLQRKLGWLKLSPNKHVQVPIYEHKLLQLKPGCQENCHRNSWKPRHTNSKGRPCLNALTFSTGFTLTFPSWNIICFFL